MAIKAIDHVNIRTRKLTESIAFYRDALGMDVRPLPGLDDMDRGAWVYAGDGRPVVHLNSAEDGADFLGEVRDWQGLSGSARVHHVAFDCDDYDGFRAQLTESGFTLKFGEVAAINLRQIFVRDPNDILVELNFR